MRLRWGRLVTSLTLLVSLLPVQIAQASLDSCTMDVSPHSVAPGSDTGFSFGLYNSNSNPVQWMRVTRPSGSYVTLESAGASGWQGDITSADTATFSAGSLPHGYSQGFSVQALVQGSNGGPVNWSVEVSDDPGGAGAITCDGDMSLVIQAQPSVINISNIRVASVGTDRVTVLWDTDVASNSKVDYGPDSSYGSSTSVAPALVTSHSVLITGLHPSTGYHFAVTSATPVDGGTATSGDNTFLTADVGAISGGGGVPPPGGAGAGAVQIGGGSVTTPTGKPTETVPPTIVYTNATAGVYKAPPTFTGTAADNEAVARLEYSTDGGKNWAGVNTVTPATATTGRGKNKVTTQDAHNVTFSFTPVITEDGNYDIVARATDPSGNQATTGRVTIVIDRLPPRFGGELVAFGAQAAVPDASGRWQAVVGLDQTITLGAVGGPTVVTVEAMREGAKTVAQRFTLRRDAGNGLWRGVMSFQKSGQYNLQVSSVDGAGNKVTQVLAAANVSEAARLVSKQGRVVGNAKVTLYYRQSGTNAWVAWDGAGFGQVNPQRTKNNGTFQMLVPGGTYYLKAEAKGFQTLVTRQFTVDKPTPLVPAITMAAKPKLGTIELPWISVSRTEIEPQGSGSAKVKAVMLGKTLPNFSLPTTNGHMTTAVGLLGRPTLVTVLSTWSPATSEQLAALDKLQENHDLNVVPLVLGERTSRVQAFLGRSGYDTDVTVDADVTLGALLGTPSLPTHYLLDRKGVVQAVWTGVVPYDRLLTQLGS
jgi:hypothetical protein